MRLWSLFPGEDACFVSADTVAQLGSCEAATLSLEQDPPSDRNVGHRLAGAQYHADVEGLQALDCRRLGEATRSLS